MRGVILFVLVCLVSFFFVASAQEISPKDEVIELKIINNDLKKQLEVALGELSKLRQEKTGKSLGEEAFSELEKTKKDLQNQTNETKMLREKLMISKDYALNGK